jgi:microcystin-dependent protein
MNILKQFIGADQVDDTKILLRNAQYLHGRNAANSGNVNLLRVNTSDIIEFASLPQHSGSNLATEAFVNARGVASYVPKALETSNITISNPGTAVFDGVTLTSGQLLFLTGQATQTENGLWIFNGSGSALTRPAGWTTSATVAEGTLIVVDHSAGAHSDQIWKIRNAAVIGTDNVVSDLASGGGGSGAKNYLGIINGTDNGGDFESNTVGNWVLGNVSLTSAFPSGSPTFGSGASGNLSGSVVSSGQLSGSYSYSYASSAATTAGNFLASPAFTIDTSDQSKVLTVKFNYKAVTNPSNANWSGTSSNSFGIALYDVTTGGASGWIMPAGVWSMTQSAGVGTAVATFQTNSSSTQYRVVVFNANSTSGAVTLYFDDFFCGPQPTLVAQFGVVGQIIATGSLTPPPGYLYCNGAAVSRTQYAELFAAIGVTFGYGDNSTTFNLPDFRGRFLRGTNNSTGRDPDAASRTAMNTGGNAGDNPGSVQGHAFQTHNHGINKSTNGQQAVTDYVYAGSPVGGYIGANTSQAAAASGGTAQASANETRPINANIAYHICYTNPVVASNDTDTRVIAFLAQETATTITSDSPTTINWIGKVTDTHGGFNDTTTYTVPVSGYYDIYSGGSIVIPSGTFTSMGVLNIRRNGSVIVTGNSAISNTIGTGNAQTIVARVDAYFLNAGDTIDVQARTTNSIANTTMANGVFSVKRTSGPSVIAATESVNGRYYASSSTPGTSASPSAITYTTKDFDSHGAYSAGTLTVPVSGKYMFTASLYHTAATTAANQSITVQILKNGSAVSQGQNYFTSSVSKPLANLVSDIISCNAGDTITVKAGNDGTTPSTSASNVFNYFSWARVGN